MTLEIAIMNTGGVALAADSAVTLSVGEKIYHSAHKLFNLSEAHSVGIMIYGNASFLEVPWETILKVYRKHIGDKCFDTLEAYTESFFDFLHDNHYPALMSEGSEHSFITNGLETEIIHLHKALADIKNDLFNEYGELYLQQEIQGMFINNAGDFLQNSIDDYSKKSHISPINEDDYNILAEKYGPKIEGMIEKHFEPHNFIHEWVDSIKTIAISVLLKDFSSKFSGIAFAGFGEKEIYPSFYLFLVDGSINRKVKFWNTPKSKSINHERKASIIPLAQRDMVNNFIEGIHPGMEKLLKNNLKRNVQSLHKSVDRMIDNNFVGKLDSDSVKEEFKEEILHLYQNHVDTMNRYKEEQFIDPMMAIVENLPKKELAEMAETLIHLTTFKKRLSTDAESVGGPIDSAVITKGDGFVWVRNKNR
ncbi:hypothetical protein [Virgibacillus sp. SK37]|uniref:hypothetical protein n=1 Tax=Virgibacillus sp. SK37 TaxID=403957 RepID=UPI0004D15754|nr:hypothetical protein [Virgibacillus sp. SK37]AIF45551.1 hypothetical protein X953_16290 [Virgibacillus sp. SK37]